jgi:hypothetical protein
LYYLRIWRVRQNVKLYKRKEKLVKSQSWVWGSKRKVWKRQKMKNEKKPQEREKQNWYKQSVRHVKSNITNSYITNSYIHTKKTRSPPLTAITIIGGVPSQNDWSYQCLQETENPNHLLWVCLIWRLRPDSWCRQTGSYWSEPSCRQRYWGRCGSIMNGWPVDTHKWSPRGPR